MKDKLILKMISYYKGDPKRIQHFMKVHEFSRLIGSSENLSKEQLHILEISAIVHDIGIKKAEELYGQCGGKLQEQLGPNIAREFLLSLQCEEDIIDRVCFLVAHHHTYNCIDGTDYQILIEADFLVNFYEDSTSKTSIQNAYDKIFKTDTGKQICWEMFGLGLEE